MIDVDANDPARAHRRRFLDRFPALAGRSRAEIQMILAAVREWHPGVPIEAIPTETWNYFLEAARHDRTMAQVGDELKVEAEDIAQALELFGKQEQSL